MFYAAWKLCVYSTLAEKKKCRKRKQTPLSTPFSPPLPPPQMKVALDMLQNELRSERTLRQVAEASASKMELEVKKLKADLQVRNPASSIFRKHCTYY